MIKGAFLLLDLINRVLMETVSLFVDVQNIYYTTRQTYKCHFDYNKFWTEEIGRAHV